MAYTTIYHPFMVIRGMFFYCYTNIKWNIINLCSFFVLFPGWERDWTIPFSCNLGQLGGFLPWKPFHLGRGTVRPAQICCRGSHVGLDRNMAHQVFNQLSDSIWVCPKIRDTPSVPSYVPSSTLKLRFLTVNMGYPILWQTHWDSFFRLFLFGWFYFADLLFASGYRNRWCAFCFYALCPCHRSLKCKDRWRSGILSFSWTRPLCHLSQLKAMFVLQKEICEFV